MDARCWMSPRLASSRIRCRRKPKSKSRRPVPRRQPPRTCASPHGDYRYTSGQPARAQYMTARMRSAMTRRRHGWRESRAADFASSLRTGGIGTIADRFPRSDRRWLLGSAAVLTVLSIAVRGPLLGTTYTSGDTSQYLSVAHSIFHGGFPNNIRPPGLLAAARRLRRTGAKSCHDSRRHAELDRHRFCPPAYS